MKYPYSRFIIGLLFSFMLQFFNYRSHAQCPGGTIPGAVAYDTTVVTGSGNYATQFSFPKFDPQNGMVTCVKICLTITGRVSMFLENNVNSPATYNINYKRKDTLTGPGLNTPLINQVSTNYGPYDLDASDGIPLSGPDFVNIGPDTVLNSVSICTTLTDSVDLSQFYGHDSVTYTYTINAGATVTGSGDYLFSVATQGSVNYKLQYCYCPTAVLPLNIHDFFVTKKAPDKAELKWASFDDDAINYHYEAEVSRNGYNFLSIGSFPINHLTHGYNLLFAPGKNDGGSYFFRIKQVYSNGYTRFSEIRLVNLESPLLPKFIIYPNPSDGIVGIKFDNISGGQLTVQIFNTQGQSVIQKEFPATGSSYWQIATLQKGKYWLRVTDVTTRLSCVNQLFIK
ncbi:MAG: choice-of-anchor E domain-containing protein [Chitinophagales bacterium]